MIFLFNRQLKFVTSLHQFDNKYTLTGMPLAWVLGNSVMLPWLSLNKNGVSYRIVQERLLRTVLSCRIVWGRPLWFLRCYTIGGEVFQLNGESVYETERALYMPNGHWACTLVIQSLIQEMCPCQMVVVPALWFGKFVCNITAPIFLDYWCLVTTRERTCVCQIAVALALRLFIIPALWCFTTWSNTAFRPSVIFILWTFFLKWSKSRLCAFFLEWS